MHFSPKQMKLVLFAISTLILQIIILSHMHIIIMLHTCRYYAGLIVGALNGVTKDELLSPCYSPVPGYWDSQPLVSRLHML